MKQLSVVLCLCLFCSCSQTDSVTDCVNPFIGTDYTGNTYPGAQVPFGMVQLSPDNGLPGWDRIAGYFYPDSIYTIEGQQCITERSNRRNGVHDLMGQYPDKLGP